MTNSHYTNNFIIAISLLHPHLALYPYPMSIMVQPSYAHSDSD